MTARLTRRPGKIELASGHTALVDSKDEHFFNQWSWQLNTGSHGKMYVDRRISLGDRKYRIFLHHAVIGYPLARLQVDHIDGNGLNNQKENLRIVTSRENSSNRLDKSTKSSKYVGVSWDKRRKAWKSEIYFKPKKIFLGYFTNEYEASETYAAALRKRGKGKGR